MGVVGEARSGEERSGAAGRQEEEDEEEEEENMEDRRAVSPFVCPFLLRHRPAAASTSTLTELRTQWRSGAAEGGGGGGGDVSARSQDGTNRH